MKFSSITAPLFGAAAMTSGMTSARGESMVQATVITADFIDSTPLLTDDDAIEFAFDVDGVFATEEFVQPIQTKEWDDTTESQWRELTKRFALGTITDEEMKSYDNLITARRRNIPSRTFEQIRADVELQRKVNATIAAINDLVNHGRRFDLAQA